jgi:hypothetical protein
VGKVKLFSDLESHLPQKQFLRRMDEVFEAPGEKPLSHGQKHDDEGFVEL